MKKGFIFILCFTINIFLFAQSPKYKIAVLKYGGGGDWYANPTSLPNLIAFCNKELKSGISPEPAVVEPSSSEIFNYPFIHMTGHGSVVFSPYDIENLRKYLLGGGFLHIDDNYGMDQFVRRELKKIFPDKELIELPNSHPIYTQKYNFKGMPKIHVHDEKAPQAFGIIHEGKLVLLYTYETDLGDGWENKEVHNDSEESRRKALQMGANIIQYAFTH